MIFLFAMFLGAGLVLSGCGDDDTATTPAPAPPPPPPPAPEPEPEPEPEPPQAPATPTGLHVDETTETSVGYHWNAVEGAIGYAVQVSMNEMFDADDQIIPTVETHIEIGPLPPMTSVYVRVAAAAGTLEAPILSDWSTHVTGMTAMPPPPPPPPPPAAIAVTFTAPDGENPMVPDDGTDEETAMATVNNGITVTSNDSAVITPMWDEDAAGVSVMAGDNMPFTFVDWSAKQADVVASGATFMIQRTTMGANQEPEPTGDVAYVTCGPFECVEGEDAPGISIANSAACQGWDPTLTLQVGKVNNTADAAADTGSNTLANPMGYDVGWSYTSSLKFDATHDFGTYSVGKSKNVAKSSSAKGLPMPATIKSDGGTVVAISDLNDGLNTDNTDVVSACHAAMTYSSVSGGLDMPMGCFRLSGGNDYIGNYEVTIAPQSAGVMWGSIAWEAFEDLTCDGMTYNATDQVDVCALFEAEVDAQHPSKIEVVPRVNGAIVEGLNIKLSSAAKQYTAAWYHDGTKAMKAAPNNLHAAVGEVAAGTVTKADTNAGTWVDLKDSDNDPIYGDLGKVDIAGDDSGGNDEADNFSGEDDMKCSADDGGKAKSGETKTDSTLCDAKVDIETSITFVDFKGADHACSVTKEYTLSCTWDADGEMGRTRGTAPTALDSNNVDSFLNCTVS